MIHFLAGEWISAATCMYVANELVDRYNQGDELVSGKLWRRTYNYRLFCMIG